MGEKVREKGIIFSRNHLKALKSDLDISVIDAALNDPTDYKTILHELRTKVEPALTKLDRQIELFVSVVSGTLQMHASWLLLAASGEIPVRILQIRPPQFVTYRMSFEINTNAGQQAKQKLARLIQGKVVDLAKAHTIDAWLVTRNLSPDQAQYLSLLKNRGIARGKLALDDLFQTPLSILNAANLGIELFGEQGLKKAVDEMNDTLFGGNRNC